VLHGCHSQAVAVDIMFEKSKEPSTHILSTGSIQTCRAERHGASGSQTFVSATTREVLLEKSKCEDNEVMLLTLSQMR